MKQKIKQTIVLATLVLLMVLSTSCSKNNEQLIETNLQLKWIHQAQFAGNYIAVEKGFYGDEGLNVTLHPYQMGDNVIENVVSGKYDFGITGADELIIAKSKGTPIKAIAVIYKINPVCTYTLDKSIKHPKDFDGKKIGIEKGFNVEYLYHAMMNKLELNELNITEIPVGFDASELKDNKVDISTGYIINEPNILIEQGYEVNTMLVADYGINAYADVLFTTERLIEENPELVQSMVSGTLYGWQYVLENEMESTEIVLKYSGGDKIHQELMLKQSIPLIFYDTKPIGWMKKENWFELTNLLEDLEIINNTIITAEIYNNSFVEKHHLK